MCKTFSNYDSPYWTHWWHFVTKCVWAHLDHSLMPLLGGQVQGRGRVLVTILRLQIRPGLWENENNPDKICTMMRCLAHFIHPLRAAQERGDQRYEFLAWKWIDQSSSLHRTDQSEGASLTWMSAPANTSSITMSWWPAAAARWSAVWDSKSSSFTE